MYEPGVDIVVIDYRTPGDLDRFLRSVPDGLQNRTGPSLHRQSDLWVGLVDSPDDLVVAVQNAVSLDHVMVHLDNCGYARAVNSSVAQGNREVIGIFNADVELTPGSVVECHEALLSNDSWGALGPAQFDDRGRFVHGGIMGTNTAPVMRGWLEHDRGQYTDVRDDAVSVAGSAYFIKREVWDSLSKCPYYLQYL